MGLLFPLGSQLTWLGRMCYNMDKWEQLGPINLLCAIVKITFKILNCIASEEIYSETLCTLAFSCHVGFLVLCPKRAIQSER